MYALKTNDTSRAPSIIDNTQARKMFELGVTSLDKIANKCGAKIKVGVEVFYDRKKLEEFFK